MSFEAWLSFCLTETVLCFIPGPAVLLVVSQAVARGARPGLLAALGILAANAMYFFLSAIGVGAAIVASHNLFLTLKWAGAAYLIYLGAKMLLARPESREPGAVTLTLPASRSFLRGFLVQGANPKALAFFTALLPQFIDPAAPVGAQVFLLGVSSVVIEFLVLAVYTLAAVRGRGMAGTRLGRFLPRLGGAFLVAAGLRLAAVRTR